jgi:SAM-dependent methyltransferase
MTQREEQEYVLGTHERELERLGFQHRLWALPTTSLWDRAGFSRGMTLLDLGSGPGHAAVELAQIAGVDGGVVAVDLSRRFLDHLRGVKPPPGAAPIRTLQGDAHRIDLDDASVDGAWARWVLCFTADPGAVVREVSRVLRPGGTFAILDYCHYRGFIVAPHSPAIERVIEATDASFRMHGGSGDVGLELPRMLADAGLEVTHFEPVVRLARPHSPLWQWPTTFFRGYTATLAELGLLGDDDVAAFHDAWNALSGNPHAYFFTPPMVGIVATAVTK